MNKKCTTKIPLRTSSPQRHTRIRTALAAISSIALMGCTSTPKLAHHAFEFNALTDSIDIELLDYRYGTSRHPGARGCLENESPCKAVRQQMIVSGDMRVGDDLFVKWRVRSSNKIIQETVDLKEKLPVNIEDHRIRFIVDGEKLFVYLITPNKVNPNPCPESYYLSTLRRSKIADERIFGIYCNLKIHRLYPKASIASPAEQKRTEVAALLTGERYE